MPSNDDFDDALMIAWPVIIRLSELNGSRLLDVRKYYKKDDGSKAPTRKGIALTQVQYESVNSAFEGKHDEIVSWFESSVKGGLAERIGADQARYTSDAFVIHLDEWVGLEMFKYECKGNEEKLILNTRHPWIESILEQESAGDSALVFVAQLLCSFSRATNLLDSGNEVVTDIVESIIGNWGIFTKNLPEGAPKIA